MYIYMYIYIDNNISSYIHIHCWLVTKLQVLRCKLDPSLRVRSAAQRVLERLAPNVLADLACRGARGGASPNYVYSSTY